MKTFTDKDKLGIILILAIASAILAIMIATAFLGAQAKADKDNCIDPVTFKTAILIDRSDSVTVQSSKEIVRRVLDHVRHVVPVNGRVAIFEINGTSRINLIPIFAACKPKAEGNRLYENKRSIEKTFLRSFEQPLGLALARQSDPTATSPLSETIIDISLSDHLHAKRSNLIIFSDLMQNSENTSIYGCADAAFAIRQFRERRAGAKERPEFKNTAIILNLVPREGIGRDVVKCRDGFWAWFFGDNEGAGSNLETTYLPGGAAIR
jgi:hypothetical protein